MIPKVKFLAVISLFLVLLVCEVSYSESEIPLVYKYELPILNQRRYQSHTVTFGHAAHAMENKITCVACHHTLEPGANAVEESCRDCHENTEVNSFQKAQNAPEEERMDHYFIAIHTQCVNCHKEVKKYEERTKAPVTCWRCHIRK